MSGSPERRGLVHWSITRPVGTSIIALAICILGVSMMGRLAVDLLPRIVYPQIGAGVSNPGVDPEVILRMVVSRCSLSPGLIRSGL